MSDENRDIGGSGPTSTEARLHSVARRQYNYLRYEQLRGCGLGPDAISYRNRTGRLVKVHPRVYSLGPPRREPVAQACAAQLACGPGAVISHISAAYLWGLTRRWESPPEVTVSRDRRLQDIRVHVQTTLGGRDVRRHLGLRVTSAARTVLDLSLSRTSRELRAMLDEALVRHLAYPSELDELLNRCPHHRGAKRFRGLVHRAAPTASELERQFLDFVEDHDLPRPRMNVPVHGKVADALYEAEKVIVELDGWDFHRTRESFERNRERDRILAAEGYLTVRLTSEAIGRQPEREERRLRRILARRRA